MTRMLLATVAALTLIGGTASAQTTTSTTETTQTMVPVVVPPPVVVQAPGVLVESTSQRTIDGSGVMDRTRTTTTGTSISPFGEATTTRKTTETTTVRQ